MRVLVTGHHGYIGSVLAPLVRDAGHEVVGLDTLYYRDCDFGDPRRFEPALGLDVRDVRPADLEGFDAVVHLAALSNDPLGDLNPGWTYAINRSRRHDRSRPRCEGSGRAAVRLFLLVQHVRRHRRERAARGGCAAAPTDGVRRVEGASGRGAGRACRG